MNRLLPVINVLGLMQMIFSLSYLIPILTAYVCDDGMLANFIDAMGIGFGVGFFFWLLTRRKKRELQPRDGFLLVALSWVFMASIATVPFQLYLPNLSFTNAFFETISGLTTTGATKLSNVDNLPASLNIWRHELQWLGGMGIIVLAVAILPMLGIGGLQLYKAEMQGPNKDTRVTARIADTAKALWIVYFGITLLCIACLRLAGMSWIDAICHAFACVGLGGLSSHDASVGFFDSALIEFILIIFMLLGAMNFVTHFLAFRDRSLRAYWNDIECKAMLALVIGSCFAIALFLQINHVYPDYLTALRHTSFNLVSIATDCGFASQDFGKWPIFAPLWMFFLSCITVSSGSTGSGIKMFRTLLLIKQSSIDVIKLLHPAAVVPLKIGGHRIDDRVGSAVLGFTFVYFMSVVTVTLTLVLSGLDLIEALTATIACINNVGPGLGVVGPAGNYASFNDFQTWLCAFTMLLGRLEVFSLFVLITPHFWRR